MTKTEHNIPFSARQGHSFCFQSRKTFLQASLKKVFFGKIKPTNISAG
jgi:hypothetical protein